MNIRSALLSVFLTFFVFTLYAQLGGRYAYTFLDQPVSARLAALGGNQASIDDDDLNIGYVNPSFINPEMENMLTLNYVNFFAGSNFGSLNYSHSFNKIGSFMGTLQFMDYGKFDYADETGNLTGGTFGASDLALTIGWGRQLDSLFSIGVQNLLKQLRVCSSVTSLCSKSSHILWEARTTETTPSIKELFRYSVIQTNTFHDIINIYAYVFADITYFIGE